MATFYITFGQRSPFRDGWVEVEAVNEEVARIAVFEIIGAKWGAMYSEKPSSALFPLGRIGNTIIATEF